MIEGVLMRGRKSLSAAMRTPDGIIVVQSETLKRSFQNKILQLPFIRGLVVLWESLVIGMRYLSISANLQSKAEEKIEGKDLFVAVLISISFAVLLFFISPLLITDLVSKIFSLNPFLRNILEGIIRLGILILYLWIISLLNDIKRVFAYHGAEHKTINAYEANADLNVNSVMKFSVEHPRCGTSFLLTLVILSIIVFSFLGDMSLLLKLVSRIAIIPILTMFAYEFIRWTSNHLENPIIKFMAMPNMAMQRLTTREPSPEMVEVSIKAFTSLLDLENK